MRNRFISRTKSCVLTAAAFLTSLAVAHAGGLSEPIVEPPVEPCLAYSNLPQVTLGVFGGQTGDIGFAGLSGTIFLPNASGRDFQIDLDLVRSEGGTYGQLATHLGLVDFDQGRAGLYAGWSGASGGEDMWRLGMEVQTRLNTAEFAAVAGWQSEGDSNLFLDSNVSFDIGDATRLSVGYAWDDGSTAKLRVEHDLGAARRSNVYVEARKHDGSKATLLAGLNIQLGDAGSAYCPPDGKAKLVRFTHWTIPRALQSSPVNVTRACTVADLPVGSIPPGCGGSASGTVVNGDTSGCVASINCD